MEPPLRQRRKITARAAAARLGVTPRTIRNYQAEERHVYLERAHERRALASACRAAGMLWAEVGLVLGCSPDSARKLGAHAFA